MLKNNCGMAMLRRILILAAVVAVAVGMPSADAKHDESVVKDIADIPEWPVKTADVGGTLLFSDSPEMVKNDGILYSDRVQGAARLLYYHVNDTAQPKKILAVVENDNATSVRLEISNFGLAAPSRDYLYVGKTTQEQYFSMKNSAVQTIAPHSKQLLHPAVNLELKSGELVYGVFDFRTSEPVRVTVVAMPVMADPLQFVGTAKILLPDESRLRGTFTGMNRVMQAQRVYNGQRDGVVAVTLADGKIDRYRTGIDATNNTVVENYGNYGVLYKITLPVSGLGHTDYYLNPRGGVYAGAVQVLKGKRQRGFMVSTPRYKPFFGAHGRTHDITYLGQFSNLVDTHFEFSPPGASNLPIRLILSPNELDK